MKRIPSFLALLSVTALLFSSCDETKKSGGNTRIAGTFTNSKGDTLFLTDVSKSTFEVLDSVIVGDDGKFEFSPLITYKGFYNISVGKFGQQFATLIVEAGDTLNVTGDAKNLGYTWKTDGSPDSKRFGEFNTYVGQLDRKRNPLMERLDSLQRTFQVLVSMLKKEDSAKVDSLDKVFGGIFTVTQAQLAVVDSEGAVFVRKFIDEQPASFANIPALRLLEPFDNFPYYEKTTVALESKYKGAPNVKMLREFIERERPYCKGQVPPDILLNNPQGMPLKLSSLKGNVVLIDFWASWCGPCMEELPNVVANYKKHHDQGFEVFSVSLDRDKKAWTDAVIKKGLVWPWHVLDSQDPNSSAGAMYRVKTIPRTFLLDREGRVIDRDLRGDALTKKLDEIFTAAPAK